MKRTLFYALFVLLAANIPIAATPASGDFLQVQGEQLMLHGQPVFLKGVNYYPQWRPWADMWRAWDAPQIARELRQARDDLGINAVRVMLPYNISGQKQGDGVLPPEFIARIRELVQIAGQLDMRVILTLFDFSQGFPAAGTAEEVQQLAYLRALVPLFANDDRVAIWDLHNEPDQYGAWREGRSADVRDWLGRMADAVHTLAPRQLVTVGMALHPNLWLPGPDGRRAIDYSDVVSVHNYAGDTAVQQLEAVRAQTPKPIIVEEFGWPTGPPCIAPYTEDAQQQLYQAELAAAPGRTAGIFAWALRDYDAAPTGRWDSREEYYGLYRADGSLKPAAQLVRVLAAQPLPSVTHSTLPLTTTHPRFPTNRQGPLRIAGTSYTIKRAFRRAWELFGGATSFGLPLTDAFERQPDRRVVQYFANAVLEYDPNNAGDAKTTPEDEQVMRVVRPRSLGAEAVGARLLHPVPPRGAFHALYQHINGAWRLGQPLSGVLTEAIGGVRIQVQYFERGRLEQLPDGSVRVGALGAQSWATECAVAR